MGTTIKSLIDDRLSRLLFDATQTRWPKATRLMWLNDALRAISEMRLDANVVTVPLVLEAGTKQAIPDGGLRVGGVTRNMDADNNPGKVVYPTTVEVMDVDPGWHTATEASVIANWMPDPNDRKGFFVYPPAVAGTKVELVYPAIPDEIEAAYTDADEFPISDEFVDAAIEWVLFRAYGELDKGAASGKGDGHLNKFANMLGVTQDKAREAA